MSDTKETDQTSQNTSTGQPSRSIVICPKKLMKLGLTPQINSSPSLNSNQKNSFEKTDVSFSHKDATSSNIATKRKVTPESTAEELVSMIKLKLKSITSKTTLNKHNIDKGTETAGSVKTPRSPAKIIIKSNQIIRPAQKLQNENMISAAKQPVKNASNESNSSNTDINEPTFNPVLKVPRKVYGKQRDHNAVILQIDDTDKVTATKEKRKSKVTRQKKSLKIVSLKLPNSSAEPIVLSDDSVQSDAPVPSIQVPKKRGRKRKVDKSEPPLELKTPELLPISDDSSCRRSKRSRQKIDYSLLNSGDDSEVNCELEEVPIVTELSIIPAETKVPKKRGRKRKVVTADESSSVPTSDSLEISTNSDKDIKGDSNAEDSNRGTQDSDTSSLKPEVESGHEMNVSIVDALLNTVFSPVALKTPVIKDQEDTKEDITKKEQNLEQMEKSNKTKMVTCAVCNLELLSSKWIYHKLKSHNNLAWRTVDPPLDLNNKSLVMSILGTVCKSKKKLCCENCGEQKKSVIGYLSHKTKCQKTDEEIEDMKIECKLCGSKMLPVSMTMHMKLLHTKKPESEQTTSDQAKERDELGKGRRSAKRASELINKIAQSETASTSDGGRQIKRTAVRPYIVKNYESLNNPKLKRVLINQLETRKILACPFEGCEYQSTSVDELISHITVCEQKILPVFICRKCVLFYKTHEEVSDHIETTHLKSDDAVSFSDCDSVSDTEATDEKEKTLEISKQSVKKWPLFLKKTLKFSKRQITYPPAHKWTLDFVADNYVRENLFPDYKVNSKNWLEVPEELLEKYAPELCQSVDFSFRTVKKFRTDVTDDVSWKRFEIFESDILEDSTITFCGGPITCLAWAPVPHTLKNVDQILAVSVSLSPDKQNPISKKCTDSGLIQFWNYGPLDNQKKTLHKPKLEYALCHEHGYIHSMDWCPSGCYDSVENAEASTLCRLGLLAVAGSDSFVNIYSVPLPFENSPTLVRTLPVIKLCLKLNSNSESCNYHATKLSWTKAASHSHIAVGYSTGIVALFNLNTESPMAKLEKQNSGVQHLLPTLAFQAHNHTITALQLHHLSGGGRWLLTSSLTGTCKFWDLSSNTLIPIWTTNKFGVTDVVWPVNWLSVFACCQEQALGKSSTSIHQFRDYTTENVGAAYSTSSSMAGSVSDWLNTFIQGDVTGEIVGLVPQQMFSYLSIDKHFGSRRFPIAYTKIIDKKLAPEEREKVRKIKEDSINDRLSKPQKSEAVKDENASEEGGSNTEVKYSFFEPLSYGETSDKYGLVFCDMNLDHLDRSAYKDIGYLSSKIVTHYPHMYPIAAINSIQFNPNMGSCMFFACGYQAGFVRMFCLKFLQNR